ncbi:MAG: hypothetical protein H0W88_12505 [Parachlamydiaceae bacterium]|nr:hypothetical protein [Parachlamydiaceae bacterium]
MKFSNLLMTFCLCWCSFLSAESRFNKIYITTQDEIKTYDTVQNQFVGAPFRINSPRVLAISPDGAKLFVTNSIPFSAISDKFYIFDTEKRERIATPTLLPGLGHKMVVSPDGKFVYISNIHFNKSVRVGINFLVMDAISGELIKSLEIASGFNNDIDLNGITITPNGEKVYIAYNQNIGLNSNVFIDVYDVQSGEINFNVKPIELKNRVPGAIIAVNDEKIYYSNFDQKKSKNMLTIINPLNNKFIDKLTNSFLFTFSLSPNRKTIYASVGGSNIEVINTQNNTESKITSLKNDFYTTTVDSSGKKIYSFDRAGDSGPPTILYVDDIKGANSFAPAKPPRIKIATEILDMVLSPVSISNKVKIAPPRDLRGKVISNDFLTQKDYINHITWKASLDASVVVYSIYRDDEFIADVPAIAILEFNDHNRVPEKQYTYKVIAITDNDEISEPIFIQV